MTIMSGVYATVAPTLIDSTNPMSYLCPGILLWSPQECHKHLLAGKLKCPVCFATGNTTPLSPWRWQLGTTERTQPRKIHNSRGIVLLVSRVYKCSQSHEVLGHDAGILECVPQWLVPFHLWHKTGVMKELVNEISILVDAGVPVASIESILIKHRRMDYTQRYNAYKLLGGAGTGEFPSFETWSSFFPAISPCWHLISTCVKIDFNNKKELYVKHMQGMTTDQQCGWLSCDHTFASAGNKGTQGNTCRPIGITQLGISWPQRPYFHPIGGTRCAPPPTHTSATCRSIAKVQTPHV